MEKQESWITENSPYQKYFWHSWTSQIPVEVTKSIVFKTVTLQKAENF